MFKSEPLEEQPLDLLIFEYTRNPSVRAFSFIIQLVSLRTVGVASEYNFHQYIFTYVAHSIMLCILSCLNECCPCLNTHHYMYIYIYRYMEEIAKKQAFSALTSLLTLESHEALLTIDEGASTSPIDVQLVQRDDILRVPPGASFPTDGVVYQGSTLVDEVRAGFIKMSTKTNTFNVFVSFCIVSIVFATFRLK